MLVPFYQTTRDHIPENFKFISSVLSTLFLFMYNKADRIEYIFFIYEYLFRSDTLICILSRIILLLFWISVETYVRSNGRMNDKLERIWKEAVTV
jgi:hypothetical protein